GRLAAAAQRITVVADAVRQQEVEIRMVVGEAARRLLVLGKEAAIEARQQTKNVAAEAVGQPHVAAQALDYAGLGADHESVEGAVWFGLDEESSVAFHFGAKQAQALFGLLPVFDHNVLQLLAQEIVDDLLVLRVDVDEVSQDSFGAEGAHASLLDGG